MRLRKYLLGLAGLGVMVGVGSAARAASFTTVNTVNNGESHLIQVLGQSYGYSDANLTVGTDANSPVITYSNGGNTLTFKRVADSGAAAGNLALNGSNFNLVNDSVWKDGNPQFNVEAKFASNTQTLGWDNLNTSTNQDILQVTGIGLNPAFTFIPGPGSPVASLSTNFLWYDTTGGNTWYSDPSKNGGEDHMATYWITGTTATGGQINSGNGAFVLAFEDLPFNYPSDKDYNDLVLQVSQVQQGGNSVPLPPAVWGGLSLLAGFGGIRLVRRRFGA